MTMYCITFEWWERKLTKLGAGPEEPLYRTLRGSRSCWAQDQRKTKPRLQAPTPSESLWPSLDPAASLCLARSGDLDCSCTCRQTPSRQTPSPWLQTDGPQTHYAPPWQGEPSPPPSSHLHSAESETFAKVPCCFLCVEKHKQNREYYSENRKRGGGGSAWLNEWKARRLIRLQMKLQGDKASEGIASVVSVKMQQTQKYWEIIGTLARIRTCKTNVHVYINTEIQCLHTDGFSTQHWRAASTRWWNGCDWSTATETQ